MSIIQILESLEHIVKRRIERIKTKIEKSEVVLLTDIAYLRKQEEKLKEVETMTEWYLTCRGVHGGD